MSKFNVGDRIRPRNNLRGFRGVVVCIEDNKRYKVKWDQEDRSWTQSFSFIDSEYELVQTVKAPAHYVEGRTIEPRSVVKDWELNFNLGNVLKYISRVGRKGEDIEDLRKAITYLEFEIEDREGNG
jgi:hypothetical protein